MATDAVKDFAKCFKVITGVEMEHAIDMELAGRHEELLIEINTAIRQEMRPEYAGKIIDESIAMVEQAEKQAITK
jgi:hypothetical protein